MSDSPASTSDAGGRSRRGSRRARRDAHGPLALRQPPWRQPRATLPPTQLLSDDQVEAIHIASLTILAEIGIDVMEDEARGHLREAGAELDADGVRVRFPPGLVDRFLGLAPRRFRLHARNPAHDLTIGGDYCAFCSVASAPNSADLAGGRRAGNHRDYRDFLRLGQSLNAIHLFGGYPVEPVDLHPSVRHLHCLSDFVTLTDKVFHAYSLGRERNLDGIEIARIARGVSEDELLAQPSLFTIINASSPLRLDMPMLRGIIEMARRNQVVVMTPFTLAGAMAPVSLAGALAQQNAEALAGLVLCQQVRPGSPFVYGGFTSNVDMRSGAPAFGTPEYMQAAIAGGQLARRYDLPYRSSNVCAANAVDAQAAYESVFALWGAMGGGTNLLMHGAGWMEGGLQASFEKMVLDADLLGMVSAFMSPLVVDDDSLALAAIREVGPGGHFFGAAHTRERFRDAFFEPMVSDWRNHESWAEAGRPEAAARAHTIYRAHLDAYVPPDLDDAIREELEAFVAHRIEQGGAPTDY